MGLDKNTLLGLYFVTVKRKYGYGENNLPNIGFSPTNGHVRLYHVCVNA